MKKREIKERIIQCYKIKISLRKRLDRISKFNSTSIKSVNNAFLFIEVVLERNINMLYSLDKLWKTKK